MTPSSSGDLHASRLSAALLDGAISLDIADQRRAAAGLQPYAIDPMSTEVLLSPSDVHMLSASANDSAGASPAGTTTVALVPRELELLSMLRTLRDERDPAPIDTYTEQRTPAISGAHEARTSRQLALDLPSTAQTTTVEFASANAGVTVSNEDLD